MAFPSSRPTYRDSQADNADQLDYPRPRLLDRTGLTGKYDFHLEYQLLGQPPPREFGAPPMAEALEKQLGLHLEKTKVPVEMLIIDHIERAPTEN